MIVFDYEQRWQQIAIRIRELNREMAAFGPNGCPGHIIDLVAEAISWLDAGVLAEATHSCELAEIAVERARL